MNQHVWWYLARSSGIVALVLLVLSFLWGVLLATRALRHIDRPAWLLDLHKWLAGTALVVTCLHLLGLLLDGYIDFGFTALFVPGAAAYRPLAVAVGIVSFYVLLAIQVTSFMRRRLSRRAWRAVHLLSYGLVWSAAIHAGLAGTDTVNRAYRSLALVLTMVAVTATVLRIVTPGRSELARPSRAEMSSGSGERRSAVATALVPTPDATELVGGDRRVDDSRD